MRVTIEELYLAWRHAKVTLYFERQGTGLSKLAAFENRLLENLEALQRKLTSGRGWFRDVDIGDVWVTPKRLRVDGGVTKGAINRIGGTPQNEKRELQVQLRCSPSPEFAIVEVLFLWRFGPMLETLLPKGVVGYRLDHRLDPEAWKERRWLFEFWPPAYAKFRSEPLREARALLKKGRDVLIITADFASYYDTIHAGFLLRCVRKRRTFNRFGVSEPDFVEAVISLCGAHDRYRHRAAASTGLEWSTGVPIGCLTSRLIANLALIPIDRQLEKNKRTICYRRYVDDILIVGEPGTEQDVAEIIRTFFGKTADPDNDGGAVFDNEALGRSRCAFEFQAEKVKVHRLSGSPGMTFINAVENDLQRLVSERRAFPDPEMVASQLTKRIVRAESNQGSRLRVFRDADRSSLERYALNTTIRALERISSLVDRKDATKLVRQCIKELRPLLKDHGDWVAELNPLLQLLRVACASDDAASARRVVKRLRHLSGTPVALKNHAGSMAFRGAEVTTEAAWRSVTDYIGVRTQEAILSALTGHGVGALAQAVGAEVSLSQRQMIRRANRLVAADLRMFDREDDQRSGLASRAATPTFRAREGNYLAERFETIGLFTKTLRLNDPWQVEPWRLYLSTRPPSYFDVSSRLIDRAAREPLRQTVLSSIKDTVNAVRGTHYSEPEGVVLDEYTVSTDIAVAARTGLEAYEYPDPRLILGNLTTTHDEWEQSFSTPSLSVERQGRLAMVLNKAALAARFPSNPGELDRSLLVLPELSLPRAWLREVAHYVQRLPFPSRFGFVVGLEYQHASPRVVENQVFAVLPGPWSTVLPWCWWKEFPAAIEAEGLRGKSMRLAGPSLAQRMVLHTEYGALTVLICSELLETSKVSTLRSRAEVVIVPAWNQDTGSYSHLVQSTGLTLGAIVAVANNGEFSDCRAWAPRQNAWERELCRLVEPRGESVVSAQLPLQELRRHRAGNTPKDPPSKPRPRPRWKPLPPDWRAGK
jgi:hypothetical protein